jgi:hypothetical protein
VRDVLRGVTFGVRSQAARGGGWNYMVAGTFLVFNLVTPILRALSLLAVLTLPLKLRHARALYTASRLAVAFSALDVMLVATPLISVRRLPPQLLWWLLLPP